MDKPYLFHLKHCAELVIRCVCFLSIPELAIHAISLKKIYYISYNDLLSLGILSNFI